MSDMYLNRNDIVDVLLAGIIGSPYAPEEMKAAAQQIASGARQEYDSMPPEKRAAVDQSFWDENEQEPSKLEGLLGKLDTGADRIAESIKDVMGQISFKKGEASPGTGEAQAESGWNRWAQSPEGQREISMMGKAGGTESFVPQEPRTPGQYVSPTEEELQRKKRQFQMQDFTKLKNALGI